MNDTRHFDELSKVLAEGITRRGAMARAARLLTAAIFGSLGLRVATVLGDEVSAANFEALYGNAGWTCTGKSQVRVAHNSGGKLDVVRPVCVFDTKCAKKAAPAEVRPFMVGCHSVNGTCPDFAECAKEMIERKEDLFRLAHARPTKTAANPTNVTGFGTTCAYAWGNPSSMYRRKIAGDTNWDVMCVSPVTGCKMPEVLEGSFLATCGGIELSKEPAGTYIVCPAVQDCLAKAIPAIPTPTVSEAKALKARQSR